MGVGVLATALVEACGRYGDRVAAEGARARLTYAELLTQARRVSDLLRGARCGADEPVHVMASNEPGDLVAVLGVWLAGAVAVPVHRDSPADVRESQLRRTRARFVVDTQADEPVLVVSTQQPPNRPLLAGAALIVFTSGSTGDPKGVVVGHEQFDGKLRQIDSLLHYREGEASLLVLSITFSFGMWCSLLTLRSGGRLVMHRTFSPAGFVTALLEERITRAGVVPTMMRLIFADPGLRGRLDEVSAAGTLRQIMIGGEPLGISLAQAIREQLSSTTLIDIYGLTETATCDFFGFPDDAREFPGAIGRPSPGVEHRIVAPDVDGIGELQIRSPYLMSGYLDDPELTAAAYDDDWLKTGDLGKEVGPGVVALMGRRKELISRGGTKVTPGEIEQALSDHPDVAAAMAVGVADEVLGERIHVLLVPRVGAVLDLPAIASQTAARLDRSKLPDAYYVADALPLGRTGKADRTALATKVRGGLPPALVPDRRRTR